MSITNIESLHQFEDLLQQHKYVVVKFSAEWCGPCKRIQPVYEKYSDREEYSTVYFTHVDVDEVRDICDKYSVEGMPTFILFENGSEVSRFSGASETKLNEMLKNTNDQ